MPPRLVVTPAVLPVTLAEAKAHLRVEHDDDDAVIEAHLAAAVGYLDGYAGTLGRALITQTWEQELACLTGQAAQLLVGPVQSLVSLTVRDEDDATVETVGLDGYRLDAVSGLMLARVGTSWPATADGFRVVVRYVAGFGNDGASVPPQIKQAILLMVGAWYENRDQTIVGVSVAELPSVAGVRWLLEPLRRVF